MNQKKNNIAIIILAAGSSSRLGRPKQLLELNGKTLLQKSIETALNVSINVTVVLGANENLVRPTISGFPINIILNENWISGMSGSIQTGMSALKNNEFQAVLIMLCDQPFINASILKGMIEVFEKNKFPIVASEYEKKVGVPAIFDASFFQKLKMLKGQKGAKKLIMNNLDKTKSFMFENGKIDIDTEEDWQKIKKSY
ncbi:MAG: nucleotidyltransferase family protein [Saprospiraceae bacterium]|jgi:molybdenum cofactor cytidylyltransferase|nr:nucleotidyltransferase family protein [Saprospiraceae bacterium]MDG1435767.1 nucleotidyltransferase family protein [Saprospiraceae bacterium]MDG2419288.1 nucleotidyltransferase family protein [Saprospiraceae bacterium]